MCGNIGRAICDVAETVGPPGLLVVEVSSFQLETVDRLKPFVAIWLNLTPDHLDRHGDLDTYGALKQRLFARQDEDDWAVWNADDPEVMRAPRRAPARRSSSRARAPGRRGGVRRGRRPSCSPGAAVASALMPASELRLPRPAQPDERARGAGRVLPLEIAPGDAARACCASYAGLEHRLEPVGDGRRRAVRQRLEGHQRRLARGRARRASRSRWC